MANVAENKVKEVSYSYDQEAKNPLGLRTKILAWAGRLAYKTNKLPPTEVKDPDKE